MLKFIKSLEVKSIAAFFSILIFIIAGIAYQTPIITIMFSCIMVIYLIAAVINYNKHKNDINTNDDNVASY